MKKKFEKVSIEQHITEALLAVYAAQVKLEAQGHHAESDALDRVVHLIKRLLDKLSNQ